MAGLARFPKRRIERRFWKAVDSLFSGSPYRHICPAVLAGVADENERCESPLPPCESDGGRLPSRGDGSQRPVAADGLIGGALSHHEAVPGTPRAGAVFRGEGVKCVRS